jgi:hypothetical protein
MGDKAPPEGQARLAYGCGGVPSTALGAAATEAAVMATGTVKWFDPNRGYGFIRPEQGKDVFGCGAAGLSRQMRPTQDGAGA